MTNQLYWAPAKSRLSYREVEGIDMVFDPLSCGSHFLSDYHMAILDQLPLQAKAAIGFSEIQKRVFAANDVENEREALDALKTALSHLQREALVEARAVDAP